jgi:hypothetical protein
MSDKKQFKPYSIVKMKEGKVYIKRVDYKEKYFKFDGKKLDFVGITYDKSERIIFSVAAVSGLKKNNPKIKKLIKAGKKLKEGIDYTDPVFQKMADVGPISEGDYYIKLTKDAPFEKTGGGWGIGGWRLYSPWEKAAIFTLQTKINDTLNTDIQIMREGFFLHHDGGNDGTAGCIGITTKTDTLKIKNELIKYQKENHAEIRVVVHYLSIKPVITKLEGPENAFVSTSQKYTVTNYKGTPTDVDKNNIHWAIKVGDAKIQYLDKKYKGENISLLMESKYVGKTIKVMPYLVTPVEDVCINTLVLKIKHLVLAFEGYNAPWELKGGWPISLDTPNNRVVDIVNKSIDGFTRITEEVQGQAYATDGPSEQVQLFAMKFIKDNISITKEGKQLSKLIMYGYSMGGDTVVELAKVLKSKNIIVTLLLTVDASTWQNITIDRDIPDNVKTNENYWTKNSERKSYIGTKSGDKNWARDANKTVINNYPCHDYNHATISEATKEDSINHIREILGLPVKDKYRFVKYEN